MARNKKIQDTKPLILTGGLKIMGSRETVVKALGLNPKKNQQCLDAINFISWRDCKWSYEEVMNLEKIDSTDCFCMAVRKAGEMNAWLIAESFSDFKKEFAEIFRNLCAKYNKTLFSDGVALNSKLKRLRSYIKDFDDDGNSGDKPSRIFKQRISDTFAKSKRKITFDRLTTAHVIKIGNECIDHLFVKGDSIVEEKRELEESQRALKQKFLSSISGNIDIELLNYSNNRVNERVSNDKSLKNSLNLSFISIGTNWETRDGVDEDMESEVADKDKQLAFMKIIIDAIVNRRNVQIDYRPHGYAPMMCKVSPHRLRKDRQWIIYGHSTAVVEGFEQSSVFSFKLERIYDVEQIQGEYIGDDVEEIKNIYKRISCNQVTYDVLTGNPILQTVVIAVKGKFNNDNTRGRVFAYNKIKEEKIHRTQTEISREEIVKMGHADTIRGLDDWGFFQFNVYDSDRIAYRLLQYQGNLKVIAPCRLQDRMRKISEELYNLYH